MSSTAMFRSPSILPPTNSSETAPFELDAIEFLGDWYLMRTSNNFWKDKSNVRMTYEAFGTDQISYTVPHPSSVIEKRMNGRNIPVPGTIATFTWQGTGLLRLFGAKWEIVGMECKENGGGDWMVTFQHKTMFTSPAVNVACRRKDGLNDEILRLVESWLVGLGDERLNAVVKNMYLIEQD